MAVCFDEEELIHLALEVLPPIYDAFCSAIRTRSDVVTLEELNTLLNAEERSIKKKFDLRDSSSFAMAVNQFNQSFNRRRGKNSNNRGCGNGRGNSNGQFSGGRSNQFTTSQSQFFGQSYNGQGQFSPSQPQCKSNFPEGQRPVCQI